MSATTWLIQELHKMSLLLCLWRGVWNSSDEVFSVHYTSIYVKFVDIVVYIVVFTHVRMHAHAWTHTYTCTNTLSHMHTHTKSTLLSSFYHKETDSLLMNS